MSVQSYVPGHESVSMTDTAITHARAQLAREHAAGLRLAVKPSGCSGYKYVLELVQQPQADDRAFSFGDVTVFVDSAALAMVNGTEIDFVKEGLNTFYKFNNPNVTGECGCGESFTVK
jgi:iron-sulfur cluster assembly accessory protein